MRDLNDKVTGGNLTADEWNDVPSEMQNIIVDMGQALSGADLDQMGKAISGMAGAASFYSESGAADAYVCDVVGAKQGPNALDAVHDGLIVRFRPGNANTGASTINVNGLGVKDLEREDGTALSAGDLATTRDAYCRYDNASDDFFLLNFSLSGPGDIIHSGAKVRRTTDGNVGSGSELEVTWENEIYDDGGWFTSGTDFVVPAGVTRVLVNVNIEIEDMGQESGVVVEIFKNGALFDGSGKVNNRFGPAELPGWNIAMIDNCVATDTYSVNIDNDSGSTAVLNGTGNHVWFAIAALEKS